MLQQQCFKLCVTVAGMQRRPVLQLTQVLQALCECCTGRQASCVAERVLRAVGKC